MWIIPDLELLQNSTVTDSAGVERPVFEANVKIGYETPAEKLGNTVEILKMTSRSLELQLHFEHPAYVTMYEEPEMLEVRVNSDKVFLSEQGVPLVLENSYEEDLSQVDKQECRAQATRYLILSKEIPKQLPKEELYQAIEQVLNVAVEVTKGALLATFILNLVVGITLNTIWSSVNAQQLMILLPIFNVVLPATAVTFF